MLIHFQNPLSFGLREIFFLRWLTIIGQIATILVCRYVLEMPLGLFQLLGISALLYCCNIFTGWRLGKLRTPAAMAEIALQLAIDITALTALLYFTGGWANPFISLYLLPIAIASATLSPKWVWSLVATSGACYTTLIFWHDPLPTSPMLAGQGFWLHMIGMWLTFVLAAILIAHFVVKLSQSIHQQQIDLAHIREENLRQEQIIGLATLAAGAAHELSTPLSTIAVLIGEIAEHVNEQGKAELELLHGQVFQCKSILSNLVHAGGGARPEDSAKKSISLVVNEWIERSRIMHPEITLCADINATEPLLVTWDVTLSQAIMNIINNAAEAAKTRITMQAHWTAQELVLHIADDGPGIDPAVLAVAGRKIISTKAESGRGIGLFLTNATLERYGASIDITSVKDSVGTLVTIRIPLSSLT